jgi:hypothetical protein
MDTVLLVALALLVLYVGFRVLRTLMGFALKLALMLVLAAGAWFLYGLIVG